MLGVQRVLLLVLVSYYCVFCGVYLLSGLFFIFLTNGKIRWHIGWMVGGNRLFCCL